jgi:hypothetical protein
VDGVTAWLGALCGVRDLDTFVSTLKENDMSYRKITVNDEQYEYVVGKQYTKIKNIGLFKNEDIGDVARYCCLRNENIYSVTPSAVKRVIEEAV